MTISSDYATPVLVNGFACRNCTEVSEAKKFVDPDHPKSGPFGGDAKSDPTVTSSPAVRFGERLARAREADAPDTSAVAPAQTSGSHLDILV